MKQQNIVLVLLLFAKASFAQSYDSLQELNGTKQKVYYSENAKERALTISDKVSKAQMYFEKELNVHTEYTLLILSPADWKIYAHPNAIYGIPHSLPDNKLVVAAQNNEFWKRNTPPVDKLPETLAAELKNAYADKKGEVVLTDFFDLLAIHELGHSFQKAAGMKGQRNWLSEMLCNVLLHTFIAENEPQSLPALKVFPEITVATFPAGRLKYTLLEDFENHYNDIAQYHPDNYGWYQCRFHTTAGKIYDVGGVAAMKKMWDALLSQKEKLGNNELIDLLKKTHPALQLSFDNWSK